MRTDRRDKAELADEYVIGLCDPEEEREVEDRLTQDPELVVLVELARQRFSALDATAAEVNVPDNIWRGVERRLDALDESLLAPGLRDGTSRAVADLGQERDKRSGPLLWTAVSGLAASLVLAVALAWSLLNTVEPRVIAVLVNDAGQPVAMIAGAENNATEVTLLGQTDVPAGTVLQLWTKPDPEGPPVSIGVFDEPKQTLLRAAGLPEPRADQLYEITFEQPGGSPTGLPTGPILGKGLAKEPR
jgi:anti-sigma-K factor RskA